MFTGIIETTGKIISLIKDKSNFIISAESSIARHLKTGQSVSHNGVCLTIEKISSSKKKYFVTAVKETLNKTNLGLLKKGSIVNLERPLKAGGRLDGHFVQGHVDCTAVVKAVKKEKGSWLFNFQIHPSKKNFSNPLIEKGSVCINGVSLTAFDVHSYPNGNINFSVAIIPHTFNNTNFYYLRKGDVVNIEFDIIGKYMEKICNR